LTTTSQSLPLEAEPTFEVAIQSFQEVNPDITEISSPVSPVHPDRHAYIVPLSSVDFQPNSAPAALQTLATNQAESSVLCRVDIEDVSAQTLPSWSAAVAKLVRQDNVAWGAVVRIPSISSCDETTQRELTSNLIGLLSSLYEQGVPALLNVNHDDGAILDQINLGMSSGLIINNACILPDGERRDYFRSYQLRDMMTQCARERAKRPWFFVGFNDLWDSRPSHAVVCRAEKLARHFEAVYEHGPAQASGQGESMPKSVSGFEVLRKAEVTDVS